MEAPIISFNLTTALPLGKSCAEKEVIYMAKGTKCYPKRTSPKPGPKNVRVRTHKRSTPKSTGKKC